MQVTIPLADAICIYGLPNHELYTDLKQWLEENQDRFLVILEDDERTLIEQIGGNERILFCNPNNDEAIKKIVWQLVFLKFEYLQIPGNSLKDPKKMETFFAKYEFFQQGIHLVASDYQNRGVDLLRNIFENSTFFSKAKKATDLFGAFSSVPAIICGAGPSLEKQRHDLKKLKDKALLFAGGTALSCLSQFGIQPHFGGFIDPHPPSARFFQNRSLEIPVFFQSRTHPQLLRQMQGPLLWVPGSQNDPLDEEVFDGGWNVSTFLVALAYHLGCNPIVLVGVDLAQTNGKSYAGDIKREEEGEFISIQGGLETRKDWLFAADWLADFSKKVPLVTWVNASNGLEIKGFEQQELKDLSFEKQEDLLKRVYSKIQTIESGVSKNFHIEDLKKSFKKVGELCQETLNLLEKIFPNSPEKNGEFGLLKLEIEKEVSYVKFLRPIWDVWKHVFARQIPKDIPSEYGIGLNQWLFIKGICDEAR